MNFKKRQQLIDATAHTASQHFIDQGCMIEAGWVAAMLTVYKDVPSDQLPLLREAFLAGAQHVFMSVIGMLDDGVEPTDRDYERMDNIGREMMEVYEMLKGRYLTAVPAPKAKQ